MVQKEKHPFPDGDGSLETHCRRRESNDALQRRLTSPQAKHIINL